MADLSVTVPVASVVVATDLLRVEVDLIADFAEVVAVDVIAIQADTWLALTFADEDLVDWS
jgi:hypothetical protein